MKRLLVSFVGLLALSLGANAQLRVLSNGHVQLGDWTTESLLQPVTSVAQDTPQATAVGITETCDTTSTISILGADKYNHSGASLTFGGRGDVMITEPNFTRTTLYKYGKMSLVGKGGINYTSSAGTIFSYAPPTLSTQSASFVFSIDVKAPAYLTSSDARYKKNVESLESMGDMLNDLTPVSYNLDLNLGKETAEIQNASVASPENDRRSFGFIAQEVREIFPDLVYEDEEGMLSVDYQGFIPLLVDAYKALNAKVSEQEKLIASLSETGRKVKGAASVSDIDSKESVVLMQNRPNPFKDVTEIRCYLPESVSDAFICIYDLNGRQQMRLNIADRGNVALTVSGSSLPAGIYIYTLITDGQQADTKRMILTE